VTTSDQGLGPAARWIGRRVQRKEDGRLVTGRGRYVDDVQLPGMLHAAFARSPVARGTITELDVTAARELDGVVGVFTAEDLNGLAREFWQTVYGPGKRTPMRVLADGDVRFVGDPVAIVVAESRYLAEDALELIEMDIEPVPPVLDMVAALDDTHDLVHRELDSNEAAVVATPGAADLDDRIAGAAHTISETFVQHRQLCVPMETRGIVATWDPWRELLELVVSGHGPHEPRLFYSRFLGIPENTIHVVMGDVGGSFGQKAFVHREEHAVVLAARLLGGQPVKWIEDRWENLVAGGHARHESITIDMAVDDAGLLVAGRALHIEDAGAFPFAGDGQMAGTAMAVFPGPYRWGGPGSVGYHARTAYTNTCGKCAYRGPWMMETTGREQMMDVVARRLGMDPLEFRRKNILSRADLPFVSPMDLTFESVSPRETLDQAAEMIGYEQFRKDQEAARAEGRLLGIGISTYVEPQFSRGSMSTEAATVRIEPSGKINVYMSTGSHGQSLETTMAQIVADELGAALDDVTVIQGDSAVTPYGPGTGGSRNAAVAGGAAHRAGAAMRSKVLAVAAHLLEVSAEDLEVRDSIVSVKGVPGAALSLARIATTAYLDTDALPAGMPTGLEVAERYKAPRVMFSNGTHAVTVEVERETGQVRILRYVISEDCGVMVNPNVVEGQIAGGTVQAIGGVFYENMIYDDEGNPSSSTFMDYLVPTAVEAPDFEYGHIETPSTTPGGYKGLGEGGAIVAPAALCNAVRDALAPLGIEITEQPLSADRLLSLIEAATATG
jgi:carbon-monoxide dehydrogenase large subunit